MSVPTPLSITYGGQDVGGSSSRYQMIGAHVVERSFERFRLVFDVLVVAGTSSGLQAASETLEDAFSKRLTYGETLVIQLGGSSWTYTHGSTILNTAATIVKSGNPDTDRGVSRAYTVSIEGEMPAAAFGGLRDIEVLVDYAPGRQATVSMRGAYTATSAGDALSIYQQSFDGEASTYLDLVDSSATFELVDETFIVDREKANAEPYAHVCTFSRQYVQLLANQAQGQLDATEIKDHRVTFTDLSQHPGDSAEEIRRLRRVVGSYDCSIDIERTTDVQSVYTSKVRPYVTEVFRGTFNPQVFAVEEERVSYDETAKRMSISLQFIYQTDESEAVVEISQSVAYRETRHIDYTPTHENKELAMFADVGFMVYERIWSRTVICVGEETPKTRLTDKPKVGDAELFDQDVAGEKGPDGRDGTQIQSTGWNIIQSTSQVTPQWVGDPERGEQIRVSVLTESVLERYHEDPSSRTKAPVKNNPITPRK